MYVASQQQQRHGCRLLIHVYCCHYADTKTISGLSVVLGKLVDTGKLELVGGQYQLSK
jgi:hypothetical protein